VNRTRILTERLVHVLDEDPDLAETIGGERRALAIDECTAPEVLIDVGVWTGEHPAFAHGGLGLLVLQGLVIRRAGLGGRNAAELLGDGDLLRPWQVDDEAALLPVTSEWAVLEPVRAAMLDERFARHLASYPQLASRLFGRALQRSQNLAVNMAIVHQARVDVRLHMLFWHLAARWGRVRSDGTVVPIRLTHAVLAELVAARRPTVTSALSDLARRGLVRLADDGWLLSGTAPGKSVEVESVPMYSVDKID
jgi:CRP-like cAMP-binding protein